MLDALQEAKKVFDREGFLAMGGSLFPPHQLEEIRHHFDAVLAGEYDLGGGPHGVNRFGAAMVKVSNAWWCDSVIRAVVLHPSIARVAARLLGVNELYLWADSLYWKAPLTATEQAAIGWHQDKQYWGISSTDQMITACVALYHADATSGGMRFAVGSHKWGLVGGSDALSGGDNAGPHGRPPVPAGQRWEEVCPDLTPGSVTFHHALTFHGSGPNLSEEPRRSITIHMVSGEGRLAQPNLDSYFAGVMVGEPFRGPNFPRIYPEVDHGK